MLSDPQSVTVATVAKSCPAISRSSDASVYKFNDGTDQFTLTVRHTFLKRNRANVALRWDRIVADPLLPAANIPASATASFTIDFPNSGMTLVEAQTLGKALRDYLSDALILKAVGGET